MAEKEKDTPQEFAYSANAGETALAYMLELCLELAWEASDDWHIGAKDFWQQLAEAPVTLLPHGFSLELRAQWPHDPGDIARVAADAAVSMLRTGTGHYTGTVEARFSEPEREAIRGIWAGVMRGAQGALEASGRARGLVELRQELAKLMLA